MALVMRTVMLSAAALLLVACNGTPPEVLHEHRHAGEADVRSLGVAASGDALHVVWVEGGEARASVLRHSRSDDGGRSWSAPVAIETDQPLPERSHRGNDLRLAAHGDTLLVVWQTRGEGYGGSGPMVLARSPDAGRSWQAVDRPPATLDDAKSHGFFGLSAAPDGRFHIAWLDNRAGQQGLHHASSADGGARWEAARTVAPATCQCCWNTLAHAGPRSYLLYRAIDPRDMALAVSEDGAAWRTTERVGAFDWHVNACPHVGGGLAALPDGSLRALVWTAETRHSGVHLAAGGADGGGWRTLGRVGTPDATYPALAAGGDGRWLAAWTESGEHAAVQAAWGRGEGVERAARLSAADVRASHPEVLVTAAGGHVFWTERDAAGRTTWVMNTLK